MNVDWQSLVFQPEWMDKLDRLAQKRFGEGGLAEEAASYALEQLSADNWSALQSFKGQASPNTFLHTLTCNYLEEFSRKRFGRPRPPEWLKRQGKLWVDAWKMVCLERQAVPSVIDQLVNREVREASLIQEIIATIKAKLPWCGSSNKEMPVHNIDNGEDGSVAAEDLIPYDMTPDDELSESSFADVLLLMSILINDQIDRSHPSFADLDDDIVAAYEIKAQDLKNSVRMSDEEKVIVKMVFQDGIKHKVIAKSLGIPDYAPGRILKKVFDRLKQALADIGVELNEIEEMLTD